MNPLIEAIDQVRESMRTVLKFVAANDGADLDVLCDALVRLDEARIECGHLKDHVESMVVDAMGDLPEYEFGNAVLTKRRSDSRKAWDHKALANDVAHRLVQSAVDFETGEVTRTTEDLISELLDYAGVSYWKVTALNKIGLVANDYCEVTEGSEKIRIQRNDN